MTMIEREANPIERWFADAGWTPFRFQQEVWNAYLDGVSGLLHAPTGTGKTYAAWGGPLREWMTSGERESPRGIRVLWITPLRALAHDTVQSLQKPIDDLDLPWTVELRTGDTSSARKQQQVKTPPTALVTTPESLSVMLSYADAPKIFSNLHAVIVDEWHELIGSKRGVQAELCLAAVRHFSPRARTWGLSATLGNLGQALATLLGPAHDPVRARLVSADLRKELRIETLMPDDVERFPWAGHIGVKLLPKVVEAIRAAGTTLLFTNTRSQAEIWFQELLRADPDLLGTIGLHHGSLEREVRREVEGMLRTGRLKAVVCTSSLDLGVDFPPVDQIVQIGSPKGLARLMQRAGRSGHQPDAVSRILGVPTNAMELIEFAAAREGIAAGWIEPRTPLDRPLDVLAQHVVTRAMGGGFEPGDLRKEVRSTHAYADLTDEEWGWVLDFLERGGTTLGAYPQYRRIERRNGAYHVSTQPIARRHRMTIGTITADSAMIVRYRRGPRLGTIEETFIARLKPGERFVFAGRTLELVRVKDMTAYVRNAKRVRGTVPRWMGGRSPLSTHLAQAVREKIAAAARGKLRDAEIELVRPLLELQQKWSVLPGVDELLIERTKVRGSHFAYLFTLEGRLVNEGLGALVAHRITANTPTSVGITANDYGIELQSPEPFAQDEMAWRVILSPNRLLNDLLDCLRGSQLQRRHFREIARIAGLIFPGYPGQAQATRHLQASSDLFFDVFQDFDPRNLLLEQARREVLDRELEVSRLRETLERIEERTIILRDTRRLTPLAFPIWADRLRAQFVSSEPWRRRVLRMVEQLEQAADRTAVARATHA